MDSNRVHLVWLAERAMPVSALRLAGFNMEAAQGGSVDYFRGMWMEMGSTFT
jgi:phosphatidylserine synthase